MYRATTKDGRVVTGYHCKVEGRHYIIPESAYRSISQNSLYGLVEIDPSTLAQATGIRDNKRNEEFPEGQEIYKGDILKCLMDYTFIQGKRVNRYITVEVKSGCPCHVFPSGILLIDGIHQAEVIGKED